MNRKIVLLFINLLVVAGCGSEDSNLETDIAVPVSVQEIKPMRIEKYINATGTVYSTQEVSLKNVDIDQLTITQHDPNAASVWPFTKRPNITRSKRSTICCKRLRICRKRYQAMNLAS